MYFITGVFLAYEFVYKVWWMVGGYKSGTHETNLTHKVAEQTTISQELSI